MAQVLLVDDDSLVRDSLSISIERSGHQVDSAPHGLEAIKMLEKQTYDLIVTDIIMPHEEGLEVIRVARGSNPDLPIIAMSGGGHIQQQELLEWAKMLGARRTLAKPFPAKDLLDAIEECLTAA